MAETTSKYRIKQKVSSTDTLVLHPETDADIVSYDNTDSGLTATNVQDAIDEIVESGVGVTGVKGNAESTYRTGQVNLTPANIGAVAANSAITANTSGAAKIKYDSKGLVTGSGSLVESDIPTLSQSKITNLTTDLANKLNVKPDGTNNLISNNKISTTYIPDILLGQLVYGGTVTGAGVATLSTNAKTRLGTTSTSITLTNNTTATTGYGANEGIFYIVSSNGSFASLGLVTGDWLISTGSAWKKIDNTDAVASVNGKTGVIVLGGEDIIVNSQGYTNDETLDRVVDDLETRINSIINGNTAAGAAHLIVDDEGDPVDIGDENTPVYVNASGEVTAGQVYAGATPITLNGTNKASNTAEFYAPTGAGTSGQVLKSNGTGAPTWVNQSTIAAGTASNFASAKTVALTGDVTGSANGGASGGWSVATTLANSGVTAGTYSAVTVNAKGLVTAGAQMIEVGTTTNGSPTTNLAIGGLYFQKID